jgi:hypothetical protein
MAPCPSPLFRRRDGIVARRIAGECILVPVSGSVAGFDRIFALNAMGEGIWDLLAEELAYDDLADRILERYDIDRPTAEADLAEFLEEMEKEGLISRRDPGETGGR